VLSIAMATEPAIAAEGPTLSLRVVAEARDDENIAAIYGPGNAGGGGSLQVGIMGKLGVDIEATWSRMTPTSGGNSALDIYPVSVLGTWQLSDPASRARIIAGLGPALAGFSERSGRAEVADEVKTGTKFSLETRLSAVVDTGFVRPPMAPSPSTVKALLVEFYGARRIQMPKPEGSGFRLGAWRVGVGMAVRL